MQSVWECSFLCGPPETWTASQIVCFEHLECLSESYSQTKNRNSYLFTLTTERNCMKFLRVQEYPAIRSSLQGMIMLYYASFMVSSEQNSYPYFEYHGISIPTQFQTISHNFKKTKNIYYGSGRLLFFGSAQRFSLGSFLIFTQSAREGLGREAVSSDLGSAC